MGERGGREGGDGDLGDCGEGGEKGVRGGDAVSARTRTHAHVRTCAHRHTFKSIYSMYRFCI